MTVTLTGDGAVTELPSGVIVTVAVSLQDAGPGQAGRLERFRETVTLSCVWPVAATAFSQVTEVATEYGIEAVPLLNTEKVWALGMLPPSG